MNWNILIPAGFAACTLLMMAELAQAADAPGAYKEHCSSCHGEARLGGIGHISDAMVQHVSDRKFETHFTKAKSEKHRATRDGFDKTTVKFDLEHLRQSMNDYAKAGKEFDGLCR